MRSDDGLACNRDLLDGEANGSADARDAAPEPLTGPTCTIHGFVRNGHANTVSDTVIHFTRERGLGGGHAAFQTRSAADGSYSIHVPPGTFRIVAEHRGDGRTSLLQTRVSGNQVMLMDLSLHQGGDGHWWQGHHHFHLGTHGVKVR